MTAATIFLLSLAILIGLIGLVLLFGGQKRRRGESRWFRRLLGFTVMLIAGVVGLLTATVWNYSRLFDDVPVATIALSQKGPQRFSAQLVSAYGDTQTYPLLGDEWQLDARVVRWKLPAMLVGAPPLYRLERLSGRYGDPKQELSSPRSVHALTRDNPLDIFELKKRYTRWLPFVDARFGSATYLPMLDGARYQVSYAPSGGLVAKPADQKTYELLQAAGW